MSAHVRVEADGPVTVIHLDKPQRRNAVDGPMAAALRDAFMAFESEDSQRVAILTGDHGHFCAGADLEAIRDPALRHELDPDGGGAGPMGPTRMALTKPVIAAVAGTPWREVSSSPSGATCEWSRRTRCSGCSAGGGACR